jgi:glycosyltransferase involved in cell wall biosynthesis
MKKPLFSIITVTYNCKDDLEKTVKSVKKQTCKDYEYIVIDGKSTDGTLEIIKKYQDNLDYWLSEEDEGIYDAMNKGAELANGKYLFFLNAGDLFANNNVLTKLGEQIYGEDMVYGKISVVNYRNKKSYIKNKKLTFFNIKLGTKVGQQGYLIKRKTFNKLGGLENKYRIASDFDLICKLYDNNCKIKKVDVLISNYDNSGISSDLKKSYEDTGRVIRDRYGLFHFIIYKIIIFCKYWGSWLLKLLTL